MTFFSTPSVELLAVVKYLKIKLPPAIEEKIGKYNIPAGAWSVSVANSGKKPGSAITIRLPEIYVALIKRQDAEPELQEKKEIIKIGNCYQKKQYMLLVGQNTALETHLITQKIYDYLMRVA